MSELLPQVQQFLSSAVQAPTCIQNLLHKFVSQKWNQAKVEFISGKHTSVSVRPKLPKTVYYMQTFPEWQHRTLSQSVDPFKFSSSVFDNQSGWSSSVLKDCQFTGLGVGWGGGGRAEAIFKPCVLGDLGRVVNSLDFCLASLKSLGCFYFRCVLSSQWKAATVNLWILHYQL